MTLPSHPTQPDQPSDRAALEAKIENLETELATLKSQWPKHSLAPALLLRLEDLEEALEEARARLAALDAG